MWVMGIVRKKFKKKKRVLLIFCICYSIHVPLKWLKSVIEIENQKHMICISHHKTSSLISTKKQQITTPNTHHMCLILPLFSYFQIESVIKRCPDVMLDFMKTSLIFELECSLVARTELKQNPYKYFVLDSENYLALF